ncbi:MAG TPA: chemotaxis-specific protein-glutamate methyltransferase CheB, partial [Longimicrobium sp.]|nr:chemotaxis-specific protein-glutamate methyltransferase CheB [Longimicrobium sp.]
MSAAAGRIEVLVVDDSAVLRQLVTALLSRLPGVEVRAAPDALVALDKMRARRPDVVLLDLEMPRMNGLAFLRAVMDADPLPVVVFSGLTQRGTESALEALRLGAVEVLAKPGAREGFAGVAVHLVRAVREAARARPRAVGAAPRAVPLPSPPRAPRTARAARLVVVGASMGGTEALHTLLAGLPGDAPGMVVAQHMPAGFTAAFARSLDARCRLEVREAADGDAVVPGLVLIAPGSGHARVRGRAGRWRVEVEAGPHLGGCRPSVDALFHSAAAAAGSSAVGVLLTGMGSDGAQGLLALRRAGAATLAQDEATSVVYGMPAAAAALGAAGEILPLPEIGAALLRHVHSGRTRIFAV